MENKVIQSRIRNIYATRDDFSTSEFDGISDVCIDNRAIGYRALTIGGREPSFEPMAELIVQHGLEAELARFLADGEMLTLVFDRIFPKRESVKLTANQGLITMPLLVKAYRHAIPGDAPTKTVLSQILAELTAHSLRNLNLILPFDGFVTLSKHTSLFPDAETLLTAARTKLVCDVLESLKLDPEIGRVKTLSVAALQSAMQPMFSRASRMLVQTLERDVYLRDTLLMLRLYVTRDPGLPKTLLGNNDLRTLSSNLTYVLAAVSQPLRDIVLPEYALAEAISESALALRELKRFSTKPLSEVRDWYVHYCLYDSPGQRVVGLLFGRNVVAENRPQVGVYHQVESANNPVWTQTPLVIAENRVEPILAQLMPKLKCQSLASLAAGVATYLFDNPDQPEQVFFANGATELELMHYAAACSQRIVLALSDREVTADGEAGSAYGLAFVNEDSELHYRTKSALIGNRVLSTDPAEAVIHSGLRENVGEGAVPTRIQGIPDSARGHLLLTNPADFAVSLSKELKFNIVWEDIKLEADVTLAQLLVLPTQFRLHLTVPPCTQSVIQSFFELMNDLGRRGDVTTNLGQIAGLRAATALSNLLLEVGASPTGRALTRAVLLRLIRSVPTDRREDVRGRLRHAHFAYLVGLEVGAKILVAMELLDERNAEDALSLISSTGLQRFMVGSMPNLTDLI